MTQQIHIIGSVYRSLVEILKEDGRLPDEITDLTGIDIKELSAPRKMLALEQVSKLWELGFETRGTAIGLEVGSRVRLVDFQDVGVFFTVTENVADLLQHMANYSALFSNVAEFVTDETQEGLAIRVYYHASVSLLFERLDFLACAGPVLASQYLDTPLKLESAELTRPKPADTTPWDEAFGVKVQWAAPVTRYTISSEEANRPILTRNEQIKRELRLILDQRLKTTKDSHPLDEIRAVMMKQFVRGVPGVDSVADALHVSTRTLHRRLSDAGTTFNDLLSEIRKGMATKYIELGIATDNVADRLGYNDLSSFVRAFKRWTGRTPAQYYKDSDADT